MTIAHTVDIPQRVAPTVATLLESELNMVSAVHHKPSVKGDTQMSRHKSVEHHKNEQLKQDWKYAVQLLK